MIVTTGGRDLERFFGIDVGGVVDIDIAFGDALMLWPNSSTSSSAVSWSMVWLMVTVIAHLEQRLDQIRALFGHAVGEFLDGDRFGHDDIADLLFARLRTCRQSGRAFPFRARA